jgi:ubiquitin carboxyl-terminal hydrolase 4/11/15
LIDDKGEKFVQLKPGLNLNNELEIFTEKAFNLAKQWYGLGEGQVPIKRFAHATNPDGLDQNVQYELYPPIFTLRKLQHSTTTFNKHITEDGKQKAPRIVASRSHLFQNFLRRAKEATGVPMDSKVKLWRVLNPEAVAIDNNKTKVANSNALLSPPQSREGSPNGQQASVPLLIKNDAFKAMAEAVDREMVDMQDQTKNDKYNGKVDLNTLGLAADQVLILEEQGHNGFLSDTNKKGTKGSAGNKKGGLLSTASSGRSSPSLGPITRGRNRASGRTQGSVGLTNLGNTCYMNSALQCIRATEELTCFFLSALWKKELNKGNPLGHEGKMAQTYSTLLDSVYNTNASSVTPSDFKRMLSKCGPQFSGYGQQDSQEFMSFLVDALHEDMNRIHKKPYIENPDSDDSRVHDEDYIKELGNIFRENYRKRNDSVIHDLFNGFYKNTMVCPICDKVSITFDPYLLLTLQLPLEHSWQHTVYFVPLTGDPVKVEIDMDKHSTILQLKEYVAKKIPGLDAKRIMMAEVFSKKFYRTVEDKQTIVEANIQSRDEMFLYELDEVPTNFPAPKKKKKFKSMMTSLYDQDEEEDIPGDESPLADVMVVPVFQRAPNSSYSQSTALANTPFFITINRDEARSYQEIYRKVLARIASMTTRDFLHEFSSDIASSNGDDDLEQSGEDVSAAETDVQTRSVESEDGIVEVSMPKSSTSANGHTVAAQTSSSVLDPGASIPQALLGLFKLRIMEKGNEMVPTGYTSVTPDKKYQPLISRLPKLFRRPSVDAQTPASSESSDVDEAASSAQASFAVDAANDSDGFVATKPKKLKTYSKKGQKAQNGRSAQVSEDDEEGFIDYEGETEEPLLHLGECLVVDWGWQNYEALFDGRDDEDMRGQETISKQTPVLEDKELSEKRKKRTERKKNGISLDECFKVTAQGEILTEENAWYCSRCKELRQAEKTLEIWTAPDILVIHLKRFSAARQFRDKIDILVDFPTEGLNLNDKVGALEDKNLTYDLFAVDNHYGGLGGGHYTAYAKNFVDEQWYEYNGKFTHQLSNLHILTMNLDSSVSKRNATSVVTSAAYLLFYRRRSSQYLGSPDLRQLVTQFRNPEEEVIDSNAEDESASRTTSPSGQGKGHRLGGSSFLNGSSSASVAAGAGRLQHRRGGDGSAAQGTQAKSAKGLPGLDGYDADADEDEGYGGGMDEDVDDVLPASNAFIGPLRPPPAYQQSTGFSAYQEWTFAGVPGLKQPGGDDDEEIADADADGDADSMGVGGDQDDEGQMRLIQDFGDDDLGAAFDNSGHQNSPIIMESTEMDFVGGQHMDLDAVDEVQQVEDIADPETVDIHVDDSPPHSQQGGHQKNE